MSQPARASALYEYIESLPEGYTGEIVDGQLYVHPRPSGPHIRVSSRLGSDLETPFEAVAIRPPWP